MLGGLVKKAHNYYVRYHEFEIHKVKKLLCGIQGQGFKNVLGGLTSNL